MQWRLTFYLVTFLLCLPNSSQADHPHFAFADVLVSVGNGRVQWRHPDGSLNGTIATAASVFTTGMAFDASGNLYVTNFDGGTVSKIDSSGVFVGTFGSGYSGSPESILFDASGNAYVGAVNGDSDIRKFDSAGNPLGRFDVPIESRGSDWIDLDTDQCTMYYSSEGSNVKRFNVCANTQLPNFNLVPLPSSPAYALRLLPRRRPGSESPIDGGLLVASSDHIFRLDSSGGLVQSYDAPGENCWFALNLDPDGSSFWSADFCTSNVYKFDIVSGAILLSFNTGTPGLTVFGLAVFGELTAANPIEPRTGPVVAVDPGHGTNREGQHIDRPTPSPTFGLFEDDLNLAIAFHLRTFLLRPTGVAGLQVWNTRRDKFNVDLMQRIRTANRLRVDLYVSVHNNADCKDRNCTMLRPLTNGTEVLYNSKHPKGADSLKLAQFILTRQVALGVRNRGVVDRCCPPQNGPFTPAVVNFTTMPAVITEVAFFTNSQLVSGQSITDEQRLNDPEFRRMAGEAVGLGVEDFL